MNIEDMSNELSGTATELERLSGPVGALDETCLNEAVDEYGRNLREFGIDECTEAAKEIFTPEVIENWATMSPEERAAVAEHYGDRVAAAFQLEEYTGVVFQPMEGKNGYNNSDGHAYINEDLVNGQRSPLQLVDTITHELRHQYQSECVRGRHDVPEETLVEWINGYSMYTSEMPWAEDPWGYKYNPLETDARYAGESVVREMTKDYMNGNYA